MILTNSVDGSACKGFGEGLGRRLKGIGACGLRSREMRSVALRIVTDGGRLRAGLAAFEVERTADYVVLWMPVGSPGFSRQGRAGGPRGSFVRPDGWEPGWYRREWRNLDVVMVHRFADEWSTWRWLTEDRSWQPGAYINLERAWKVGEDHYDTDDLTLDVVISGDGEVSMKDEEELVWAEEEGIYSAEAADRIRQIGEAAAGHFARGGWPLDANWESWRMPSGAGLPTLPATWQAQPY